MKLLFLTQTLDRRDAVLGFVSRWVEGLARHCEAVRVIALEVGDTSHLPRNVDWREVGREGRVKRYFRYRRFLKDALQREGFDTVLSHMVPRYALVSDGLARRAGAGRYLWYTHAGVDARLRKAVPRVQKVFTASEESLRIESPNKVVTGHGIDLEHFSEIISPPAEPPRLLSVGRLTPRKDPMTILHALHQLVGEGRDVHLDLVGGGLTGSDIGYREEVLAAIDSLDLSARVALHGSVPYLDIPEHYRRSTLVVNASLTGSLDKVSLEAMASRRPVISCNDSAPALFAELGEEAETLYFPPGNQAVLAACLRHWLDAGAQARLELGARLVEIVRRDHDVDVLMARLVALMGGEG